MSKEIISKELLNEVFGEKVVNILSEKDSIALKNYIVVSTKDTQYKINIYELAHKCKEWADGKGYVLRSEIMACRILSKEVDTQNETFYLRIKDIFCHTEPEAIFKACQWVLENKANQ